MPQVGKMLTDQQHTTFMAVCIAEYLSINETCRLLKELRERKVCCTHVCVNQLVKDCEIDIAEAEKLLRSGGEPTDAARRVMNAVTLCGARQKIQSKYLQTLREADEAKALRLTVVRGGALQAHRRLCAMFAALGHRTARVRPACCPPGRTPTAGVRGDGISGSTGVLAAASHPRLQVRPASAASTCGHRARRESRKFPRGSVR